MDSYFPVGRSTDPGSERCVRAAAQENKAGRMMNQALRHNTSRERDSRKNKSSSWLNHLSLDLHLTVEGVLLLLGLHPTVSVLNKQVTKHGQMLSTTT
jgi:hypothetical protein